MFLNQENIRIFFFKQENVSHSRKLILSLLRENLSSIEKHISKQEPVLIKRKLFLARKYFLFQEKHSYSETNVLNHDKFLIEKKRKFFKYKNFQFLEKFSDIFFIQQHVS